MKTDNDIIKYLYERTKICDSGCHEWQYGLNTSGYGECSIRRYKEFSKKKWRVHRLSYTSQVGDIPDGLFVCHKCDNRKCLNPDHLFLGTHQDNMDDMHNKGRYKKPPVQYGNNNAGIKVMAGGVVYENYVVAGNAFGISDNAIRKRIKNNWVGYSIICE